jgi:NTP pyrophosphatase (non-canonical NTP hydrolase)
MIERQSEFDKYQEWTRTTAVYPKEAERDYLSAGLVAEVGELYGAMAKYHRGDYGVEEFNIKALKELGDILWFLARISDYYGYSLSRIARTNYIKLEDRKLHGALKGSGESVQERLRKGI